MPPDLAAAARRAYRAFAERDLDRLRELCHREIEIDVPTAAVAGRRRPYRGHEGIVEYLEDLDRIWDELELRPHEFVETAGRRVVVIGRVITRRERTRNDLPSVWVLEFRDRLVVRVNVYSDAAQVAASIEAGGAVPEGGRAQ
jgi:ketosteroid isomerase-like protein